jgi:flagellar basal body-associated protein FliL
MIVPPAPSTIPASPSTPASSAPSKLPVSKKKLIILISIFLLLLASAFLVYTYRFKDGKLELFGSKTKPESSQSDKPIKLLPSGKQVYNFSHSKTVTGPKPSQAVIDPIDPQTNQQTHFEIKIAHPNPVDTVHATLITDNQQKDIKLKLKDGSKTDGTWAGTFTMKDSYNYTYQIAFIIKSQAETYEGALTFR